jgi:AcrR family transcriptional regulator
MDQRGGEAEPAAEQRRYAGLTPDERREDRRQRLLAAALQLFGTTGYANTSIERLCQESGVSTRYFYEEFTGREALLEQLYLTEMETATRTTLASVALLNVAWKQDEVTARQEAIRVAISAYITHVCADPRRLRVLHRESHGLSRRRAIEGSPGYRDFTDTWNTLLRPLSEGDPVRYRFRRYAIRGAVNEVLVNWLLAPEPRPDVALLCDHLTRIVAGGSTNGLDRELA